jgi:hypothetical protein
MDLVRHATLFSALRVLTCKGMARRRRGRKMSVTKTEIKSLLKNELLYISHPNNKPMFANGGVCGDFLACDIDDSNGRITIFFFWRSKNDSIQEPSDAEISSRCYLDSMCNVMPKGYEVYEHKDGLRFRKEYSSEYSVKEIVREIMSVYQVFGGLQICRLEF